MSAREKGASKYLIYTILALFLTTAFQPEAAAGNKEHNNESFDTKQMIMHHITDGHSWHIMDGVTWHLPVILYSSEYGLDVFMSSAFQAGHHETKPVQCGEATYVLDHGDIYFADKQGNIKKFKNEAGEVKQAAPLDLSITKNVASMFLSVILMVVIFVSVANKYKKRWVPKGLQGFVEPLILHIRDEMGKGMIGPKHERFMPYLLTIFFFIFFNNLLGLFPAGANVTGNLAVTGVLAIFTLLITLFSSNKHYWAHIFNTPGVPWWLKWGIPIMPIVEVIGVFTKPFALMVRLFANITAGHIIILSLFSLIFIFKSITVSFASVPFAVFMYFMELLVAFIQAYIFTILSAMYFGGAVEEHHHEEETEAVAG